MMQRTKGDDPAALLRCIRAHCLDCMGGSREQVAKCGSVRCTLHAHRMGPEEAARYHDAQGEAEGFQLSMLEGAFLV